ncbi:hypothetical protein QVD17_30294 [Tagetes erecta]|uniref:Uncharacterized protein n=1 Tax=Tagetes erecta TaxID=13708 RepID=A0AAD8K3E6_TARER|nr:hypothetical protein QVD17_30294 [Tagetes erecta]
MNTKLISSKIKLTRLLAVAARCGSQDRVLYGFPCCDVAAFLSSLFLGSVVGIVIVGIFRAWSTPRVPFILMLTVSSNRIPMRGLAISTLVSGDHQGTAGDSQ